MVVGDGIGRQPATAQKMVQSRIGHIERLDAGAVVLVDPVVGAGDQVAGSGEAGQTDHHEQDGHEGESAFVPVHRGGFVRADVHDSGPFAGVWVHRGHVSPTLRLQSECPVRPGVPHWTQLYAEQTITGEGAVVPPFPSNHRMFNF